MADDENVGQENEEDEDFNDIVIVNTFLVILVFFTSLSILKIAVLHEKCIMNKVGLITNQDDNSHAVDNQDNVDDNDNNDPLRRQRKETRRLSANHT